MLIKLYKDNIIRKNVYINLSNYIKNKYCKPLCRLYPILLNKYIIEKSKYEKYCNNCNKKISGIMYCYEDKYYCSELCRSLLGYRSYL